MRFYHVADVHLGAAPDAGYPWSEQRKTEIWQSFRRLIERAGEEQVDLLLIAGDLFHRQPLQRELKEVNYLFSTLPHTKVVLIAGNHDYLKKDSCYFQFPWNENVTCLFSGEGERVVFPNLQTAVYGLSYHTREIRDALYDNWKPKADGLCSILLAHGGDEKHIPMDKRRLLESGFDYVALGHIHKPQKLTSDHMAYAGALEPIDKNDLGVHGFISGTYERGKLQTVFVPWACREYRMLKLTVDEQQTDFSVEEQLRRMIQEQGTQHIYKICLTGFRDPDIQFQTERYEQLGNVAEVTDATSPAYDFARLLTQHEGDVIGCYIEKLFHPDMTEMERKALYYGVQALLEVRG